MIPISDIFTLTDPSYPRRLIPIDCGDVVQIEGGVGLIISLAPVTCLDSLRGVVTECRFQGFDSTVGPGTRTTAKF